MMELKYNLSERQFTWLITGVAGFIGSRLLETLLKLNHKVVGLDNFSTGRSHNLQDVKRVVSSVQWSHFKLIKGDICCMDDCRSAVKGVDYVLHHAAMGSVPMSVEEPLLANDNNVNGFLNILRASQLCGVKRVVYASSCAIYGAENGKMQSPYALTKLVNELYADVFFRVYGLESVGLRYFNVYGPRQDPTGAYAAVIPTWINAMINNEPVFIYGDGQTTRDFCFIDDVVKANLLAACSSTPSIVNQVFDVGFGNSISLNTLLNSMQQNLLKRYPRLADLKPVYLDFRSGDLRYSQADMSKTNHLLQFVPEYNIDAGLSKTLNWYFDAMDNAKNSKHNYESAGLI